MLRMSMMGLGAIGNGVLDALRDGTLGTIDCPAVLVKRPRPFKTDDTLPVLTHDPDLFFRFKVDLVLEVAGHEAVREHGARILRNGSDLMVTSIGALADQALLDELIITARGAGTRIHLPSAGVGALDILCAAATGGLDEVVMTVRKAPLAWEGTIAAEQHALATLREAVCLYDGPVRQGAASYPQNVNISAAVALAGLGLDQTRLRIFADPGTDLHVVEIEAKGKFGSFSFREAVVPAEDNPKTGKIVAMAIIKTLRQMVSPLVIGG